MKISLQWIEEKHQLLESGSNILQALKKSVESKSKAKVLIE